MKNLPLVKTGTVSLRLLNACRALLLYPATILAIVFFSFSSVASAQGSAIQKQPLRSTNKVPTDTTEQLLYFSRPGKSHALLGLLSGNWNFQDAKRTFVKGTLTRKPIYNGRFYQVEITGGKLQVPVEGGAMKEENYQQQLTEGFDNARNIFVTTSINNHIGSEIEEQVGSYDSLKKCFTYTWESELIAGVRKRVKRVVTIIDEDHYTEEYYEEAGGLDRKVRQLNYSRLK